MIDKLTTLLACIADQFILAFIACLYSRVFIGSVLHCESDELLTCVFKFLLSPLIILSGPLKSGEEDPRKLLPTILIAAIIVIAIWMFVVLRRRCAQGGNT